MIDLFLQKVNKGEVGDGALYVVLILLVAVGMGSILVGNLPTVRAPKTGQQVSIIPPSAGPTQNELQLYTFKGVPIPSTVPGLMNCGYAVSGTSEPSVLYAYTVDSSAASGNQLALKVFYTDEWPLTLGSGSVSPMTQMPDHVANPNVGDRSAKDSNNFPYFPAVFMSDVTNDANNKSGDAQNGGTPQSPGDVYGAWKALGGSDPLQKNNGNGTNVGPGADGLPTTPNGPIYTDPSLSKDALKGTISEQYTAEIIWKIANLTYGGQPLQSGHSYRAEVIIHDGDKDGDIGIACAKIAIP